MAVAAGWLCTSSLLTMGGLRTEGAGVQFGHAGKSSWSCSDRLNPVIDELSKAIEQEAERRPEVQLLMTHPGVGPITALAFALIIGTPERLIAAGRSQAVSGLIPCEESSADHWRLGHISKQGNALMRSLLEAAQVIAPCEPGGDSIAFIWCCAAGVRSPRRRWRANGRCACWMWRKGQNQQVKKFGSHAGAARDAQWC